MTKKSIMILFIVLVSPAVTYGFPIANDKFACPGTQYPITINQFVHNLSGVEGLFITGKERKSWFRGEDGLYYVKLENAEIGVTIRFGFRQQSGIAVMERLAVKVADSNFRNDDHKSTIRTCNRIGSAISENLGAFGAGGVKSDDYEPSTNSYAKLCGIKVKGLQLGMTKQEALNALKKLSMQDDMRAFNPQINITEKS